MADESVPVASRSAEMSSSALSSCLCGDALAGDEMFLLEKEVDQLLKGTWEADCLEMKLIQNGSDESGQFVGKGFLRQEEGGKIQYRLYPTAPAGNIHPISFQPQGV